MFIYIHIYIYRLRVWRRRTQLISRATDACLAGSCEPRGIGFYPELNMPNPLAAEQPKEIESFLCPREGAGYSNSAETSERAMCMKRLKSQGLLGKTANTAIGIHFNPEQDCRKESIDQDDFISRKTKLLASAPQNYMLASSHRDQATSEQQNRQNEQRQQEPLEKTIATNVSQHPVDGSRETGKRVTPSEANPSELGTVPAQHQSRGLQSKFCKGITLKREGVGSAGGRGDGHGGREGNGIGAGFWGMDGQHGPCHSDHMAEKMR